MENGKEENTKEVLNTREVSVCLFVLFLHPWVSVYLCVQLWLERGKRGWSVPGPEVWALPLQRLAQRAYSYYSCWSYLREIRSGPANETHAKPLLNFSFLFWSISFPPWSFFIINHLSRLCIYMDRQTHTTSSDQIIHLQPWPSMFAWNDPRTYKSDTQLIRRNILKCSSIARKGPCWSISGSLFISLCF